MPGKTTENQAESDAGFEVVHLDDLPPTRCPCGTTRRAFVDTPDAPASLHRVTIDTDAKTHYHKKLTEIYYILEGEGVMELDGERVPVKPGSSILIRPGCRHRAVGDMVILNMPIPKFDPDDEWFD
jgi:mannose-6-phosphate isomerase-like protein (cupin superfamily)